MNVVWTDEALEAFDALRMSGSEMLFERVRDVVVALEANPRDHRIGARWLATPAS